MKELYLANGLFLLVFRAYSIHEYNVSQFMAFQMVPVCGFKNDTWPMAFSFWFLGPIQSMNVKYFEATWENTYCREVIYLLSMGKDIYTIKWFVMSLKNSYWKETIQLLKMWQVIHNVKYFKATWENRYWWEIIQLLSMWQDIYIIKWFMAFQMILVLTKKWYLANGLFLLIF